ncbi:MAG: CotH kinase family protein, partial [Verrucomicrobiales bacterium]|nr:CotH kinase family protein [Verrucomicrobiales bacterium]
VTNHNNNSTNPVNSSANGWLIQGTHWQSYMDNGELNLISDGHGDNKCNRAEIDATGMTSGRSYTVSFDARWVYGKPRLIMQTWDHSIGESFLVPVPNNLGTPGTTNTAALPAAPPEIASVTHSPAVPRPGQPVTITAKVTSSSPLASVQVRHRSGNSSTAGNFSTATMFDNGISGGDEIAGDGIYSAVVSNYTSNNNIGQFYVQANADNGQSSTLPKKGPTWPAMWVVDDTTLGSDLRTQRFIIAQFDRNALSGTGLSATYDYNFERMSNHYFNATFISNERDILYNCELRKSGSPWTRDGGSSLSRGKIKFPQDQPFRGWTKRMFDNDANGGSRHHNRITRYWLYLLGHEAPQNEYIRHVINGDGPSLVECTEPIQNDYLDRIYPDGSSGELLRIDDQWWFDDNWGRQSQNADWSYKGTTNPIRYHSEWIRRSQETEYDYSAFINWTQVVSSNSQPLQTLERFADTQKMTANAAVRGWIGDWDSLTLNRGKNCYFFRRPTDGKWTRQHWDSDLAFRNTGETFVGNLANIRNYFYNPAIRRYLNYYIGQMIDNYTTGSPRLARWLAEEDAAFGVNEGTYNNWNSGRISRAQQELGASRTAPFNSSAPGTTAGATATVTGSAPYNIFTIEIPGHPEAIVTWNSTTSYSVSAITLATGSNPLTLNGVDHEGNILGTTNVTINKTGNAAPVIDIDASPGSWQLAAGESLELDATASFDPDLTPLSYTWSVSPNNGVTLSEPAPGRAALTFAAPGLYDVTLTTSNGAAQSTQVVRQASVYSFDDFASFGDPVLPADFTTANVENRDNYSPGAWYSLEDRDGALTVKVNRDGAHPLVASGSEGILHAGAAGHRVVVALPAKPLADLR